MSTHNDTRTAADLMAQIQEHRQPVDFEHASSLFASRINDAPRDAISRAHDAAWQALLDDGAPERVRQLPAVALIEAKEIICRAALLSMAEYLEEFDMNAPTREDVTFEIASLAFLLRTTPAARAPKPNDWLLRGLPSTMRESPADYGKRVVSE